MLSDAPFTSEQSAEDGVDTDPFEEGVGTDPFEGVGTDPFELEVAERGPGDAGGVGRPLGTSIVLTLLLLLLEFSSLLRLFSCSRRAFASCFVLLFFPDP